MLLHIEQLLSEAGKPDDVTKRRQAREVADATPISTAMHLATDPSASRETREVVAASVVQRVGRRRLSRTAAGRRAGHEGWRRIAALRILVLARAPEAWPCLKRALQDSSPAVRGAAVILLGQLHDRRAGRLLVDALREGRHARSRIATALDVFPLDLSELVIPCLTSEEPAVRYWGARLARRYATRLGVDTRIGELTADPDPMVRRAALETLGEIPRPESVEAACARLTDPVAFVRAHAARTLGALGAYGTADRVAPLLADREWAVRAAAKATFEAMGPKAAPAVEPYLTHEDAFARNGAAEVLQNMGVFEKLLVEEALYPSAGRRQTLRRLAQAGGFRMWDSVLDRLSTEAAVRARQLLDQLGLDGHASTS